MQVRVTAAQIEEQCRIDPEFNKEWQKKIEFERRFYDAFPGITPTPLALYVLGELLD